MVILYFIFTLFSIAVYGLNVERSLFKWGTNRLVNPRTIDSNIILFDGVCNFCNQWVDTLKGLDRDRKFNYCALQSDTGKLLLDYIGKSKNDISSVVYIKSLGISKNDTVAYSKSDAALKVLEELEPKASTISKLGITLPRFIRDGVYDIVADNRYRIMGKRNECRCGSNDDDFV